MAETTPTQAAIEEAIRKAKAAGDAVLAQAPESLSQNQAPSTASTTTAQNDHIAKLLQEISQKASEKADLKAESFSPDGYYGTPMNGQTMLAWTKSSEFLFSLLFVCLTIAVLVLTWFLRPKRLDAMNTLRLVLLPMVVCCAVCLVVAGYSKDQINVVMPLLALIAGNLLARTSHTEPNASSPTTGALPPAPPAPNTSTPLGTGAASSQT